MGEEIDGKLQLARWKPFIMVGIAYFLIAVIYPIFILTTKDEQGHWTIGGFVWSFVAGIITSFGALGIILAFNYGGRPVFVMPLVFGCAPVVNTLVTMIMARTFKEASLFFYTGVLVVAIGAAGVMYFKPSPPKSVASESENTSEKEKAKSNEKESENSVSESSDKKDQDLKGVAFSRWLAMMGSIAMTAFCWGAYGPLLHKGQVKMSGSKMRPLLCVGLAYFVVAVLIPIPMLGGDPGDWSSVSGISWSLFAGVVGAFGSLGIIYAFNFGGKPIFVMPLIFGMAPVVNTLSTTLMKNLWAEIEWTFLASLALVILGAITVLICAPKNKPPGKSTAAAEPSENDKQSSDDKAKDENE